MAGSGQWVSRLGPQGQGPLWHVPSIWDADRRKVGREPCSGSGSFPTGIGSLPATVVGL